MEFKDRIVASHERSATSKFPVDGVFCTSIEAYHVNKHRFVNCFNEGLFPASVLLKKEGILRKLD